VQVFYVDTPGVQIEETAADEDLQLALWQDTICNT
jgi:hypothetical protein